MALKIYYEPVETSFFSATKPFTVTFDGTYGGHVDTKLYIRNDNNERYYTDITLSVHDHGSTDKTDGSVYRWEWKFAEKDFPLVQQEWMDIAAGNTLTLSADLGTETIPDTGTFLPFWIRVTIPEDQQIQTITSIDIAIDAIEYLVED